MSAPATIWTGTTLLDLRNPDPDDIHIEDIARGLSRAPRFAGQTEVPLSVAEHCLLCEEIARHWPGTPRGRLAMLLHDAPEAYICDLPSPLKAVLPDYERIEARLLDAVWTRFSLPRGRGGAPVFDARIDAMALGIERRACLPGSLGIGAAWTDPPPPPDWAPTAAGGRDPDFVRQRFLYTAEMLIGCTEEVRG